MTPTTTSAGRQALSYPVPSRMHCTRIAYACAFAWVQVRGLGYTMRARGLVHVATLSHPSVLGRWSAYPPSLGTYSSKACSCRHRDTVSVEVEAAQWPLPLADRVCARLLGGQRAGAEAHRGALAAEHAPRHALGVRLPLPRALPRVRRDLRAARRAAQQRAQTAALGEWRHSPRPSPPRLAILTA